MLKTTGFAILLTIALAAPAAAQEVTVEKPASAKNALYLEVAGNGGFYSMNYERYLRDDASVRGGLMYMTLSASAGESSANATWMMIPLMFNYTGLAAGSHALELGAGVSVMYVSAGIDTFDESADASGVIPIPTATAGYRYASRDGGFLFRAGYTPLFFVTTEEKAVFHWGGASFGYRF